MSESASVRVGTVVVTGLAAIVTWNSFGCAVILETTALARMPLSWSSTYLGIHHLGSHQYVQLFVPRYLMSTSYRPLVGHYIDIPGSYMEAYAKPRTCLYAWLWLRGPLG